jgi:hypothetical protein
MRIKIRQLTLIAMGIVFALASHTPTTYALETEQDFLLNAINNYDRRTTTCTTPASSTTALSGSENLEKIYNYFRAKGLSDVQSAGIVGNISVESGGFPGQVQGKGIGKDQSQNPADAGAGGWGIIQWTPGTKINGLMKEAGITAPVYELTSQLDLLWAHMQNNPPITKGSFDIPEYKKITDIKEAVNYFEDKIEGAGKPNYTERYTRANLALDTYAGGSPTDTNTATSASTSTSPVDCENSSASAGLTSGGMSLQQAKSFMNEYKNLAIKYAGRRGLFTIPGENVKVYGSGCTGSGLANCSTFSEYFVGKYTTGTQAFPNGKDMVRELLATNSGFKDGKNIPKTYAVFSRQSRGGGSGHTGVVLGINKDSGKMIIGEASCNAGIAGIVAKEVSIKDFTEQKYQGGYDYSYAYTDGILKNSGGLST